MLCVDQRDIKRETGSNVDINTVEYIETREEGSPLSRAPPWAQAQSAETATSPESILLSTSHPEGAGFGGLPPRNAPFGMLALHIFADQM